MVRRPAPRRAGPGQQGLQYRYGYQGAPSGYGYRRRPGAGYRPERRRRYGGGYGGWYGPSYRAEPSTDGAAISDDGFQASGRWVRRGHQIILLGV